MVPSHYTIKLLHGQRGAVAILFVLCLAVLLGFAALALDLARLNLTKIELQNAADAAALAGARSLSDTQPPPGSLDHPYNWSAATATALVVAQRNVANASLIQNALIETGYWNLQYPALGLRGPSTPGVPVAGDVPAIRATVVIDGTHNNGPFKFLFAPVFGITERNITASAIAVLPAPGGGTGIFPMVIGSFMFDHYWDSATRCPRLDPATGKPYLLDISIGSVYFGGDSGTWTTFTTQDNDVTTVRQLIAQGNPTNLSIGMETWIQTGVKDALFNDVPTNKDVAVFVVDNVNPGTWQPIVAIAGFHITGTGKTHGKSYIQGQFIENVLIGTTNPGSGNGLPLGAYTPSILVE